MNAFTSLPDEKEVLGRLKNGDEKAFALIYDGYWKPMFYLAAAKLHSLTEAEEVVQDVFLDIWNRREEMIAVNSLSSYLAVSVRYRIINAMAKKSRYYQYQKYSRQQTSPSYLSTENNFDFDVLRTQLEKETAKLPDKCQLVFRLSREGGYSHKQIAAKLRISEKTVEAHLTKALRMLRAGLSQILSLWVFLILY